MSHFSFETWFYHLVRTQFPTRDADDEAQDTLASLRSEFTANGLDPDAMAARARLQLMNGSDAVAFEPGANKQVPRENAGSSVTSISTSTVAQTSRPANAADVANDTSSPLLMAAGGGGVQRDPPPAGERARQQKLSVDDEPLETIQTAQGEVKLYDDGTKAYVYIESVRPLSKLGTGPDQRTLIPAGLPGFYEVEGWTEIDVQKFARLHVFDPQKYPIKWE